jgi:hypothetical protein
MEHPFFVAKIFQFTEIVLFSGVKHCSHKSSIKNLLIKNGRK